MQRGVPAPDNTSTEVRLVPPVTMIAGIRFTYEQEKKIISKLVLVIVIAIDNASSLTITKRCCHVTVRVPHLLLSDGQDPPHHAGDPGVDPGVVRAGAPLPVADDAELGVPDSVHSSGHEKLALFTDLPFS